MLQLHSCQQGLATHVGTCGTYAGLRRRKFGSVEYGRCTDWTGRFSSRYPLSRPLFLNQLYIHPTLVVRQGAIQ